MDYTEIAYEVEDRVATITLDRPDRLNAFTPTMMREMIDAFDRVDADDDVRVGDRHRSGPGFCAGRRPRRRGRDLRRRGARPGASSRRRPATAAAWSRCGSSSAPSR